MSGPESPQNRSPRETVPSIEKEQLVLSFAVLRKIIISQLEGKTVNKLELSNENGGLRLRAEIDAGLIGGRISLNGLIINSGNEVKISNLDIQARSYVKVIIESKLHYFSSVIKEYLKKIYGESAVSLHVTDNGIIVDFSSAKTRASVEKKEEIKVSKSQTGQTGQTETQRLVDEANEAYKKAMEERHKREGGN